MANGFGNTLKQISDSFTTFVSEVREFMAETREFIKEQRAFNKYLEVRLDNLEVRLDKMDVKIDFLVAELSRYKGDSGEMLLSIYAFCTIYGVPFSYGNLANMGMQATRESRRRGAVVQTTADPRFGQVNLYEPRVLEDLFLPEEN